MDIRSLGVAVARHARHGVVKEQLDLEGYSLVAGLGDRDSAILLMQSLGVFIKQYTGAIDHDVKYRRGFDDKAYSQSRNTILAHTEAPGWGPSPRFLALYCNRQARCGGGYTDLLDCNEMMVELDSDERHLMESVSVFFPGPNGGVNSPMLGVEEGRRVLRFSYNLLVSGDYDPVIGAHAEECSLPLGSRGESLAHKVVHIFEKQRISILIPDGGLLILDNQRMLHARAQYSDKNRHLTRYWIA